MAKKRKTELDIDLDLEDIIKEKAEEVPEPPVVKVEEKKKEPFKLPVVPPKIIIITIAAIVGVGLLGGVVFYFYQKEPPKPEVETVTPKEEAPAFVKVPQYQFEPFFIPIKKNKDEDVFLKISFSFDLSNELVVKEIEQNITLLRANLSFLLRKRSLQDLESDPDKKKLSRDLINIINRSLQNGEVKKLYLTQFFFK